MSDTTAKIRAKGLDGTAVTEDLAAEMHNHVGSHYMAIVDLQVVDKSGPNVKGKRVVELVIDGIEPATETFLADHLRELSRTLYQNRALRGEDRPLSNGDGDDPVPGIKDVVAQGEKHRPHPYIASTLSTDDSEEGPVCDVCGTHAGAAVHADRSKIPDPFDATQGDPEEKPEEEADDEGERQHDEPGAGDDVSAGQPGEQDVDPENPWA